MVALCVMWFIASTGWKQGSCELFEDDDTSRHTFGGEGNVVKRSAQTPAYCEAILGKIRMDGSSTGSERDLQTSTTSLAGTESETTPATDLMGWVYYSTTKMCYKKFNVDLTSDEAEKKCNGYDGHLASIHSMEQNQFLLELNPENDSVWIGLKLEGPCDPSSRQEHWLDSSDVDFHNWKEWEPNNLNCIEHSVYMDQTGGWYDFPDNESNPFICETKDIFYCPQHAT
ncbi:hypothetical protein RB195_008515 [Necator americanus]|uniref:C-type lectin domain-containing protein n=1 Tax=Necator americanus TaxID=51031 RepID=A0ABR1CQ94_NECAM